MDIDLNSLWESLRSASVGGVPLILYTFGLVEFLKKIQKNGQPWLQGNALTVASAVIGLLFFGTFKLSGMFSVIQPWLELVVFGLGGAFATSGIYDFIKSRTVKLQ